MDQQHLFSLHSDASWGIIKALKIVGNWCSGPPAWMVQSPLATFASPLACLHNLVAVSCWQLLAGGGSWCSPRAPIFCLIVVGYQGLWHSLAIWIRTMYAPFLTFSCTSCVQASGLMPRRFGRVLATLPPYLWAHHSSSTLVRRMRSRVCHSQGCHGYPTCLAPPSFQAPLPCSSIVYEFKWGLIAI